MLDTIRARLVRTRRARLGIHESRGITPAADRPYRYQLGVLSREVTRWRVARELIVSAASR